MPSGTYTVGQIVKPTAPALKAQWTFRCTTAGTASTEPTWPTANNSTITTGGATFTNVTGQSAYFWTAASGDLATLLTTSNRLSGGDRVFLSSDHTESQTSNTNYGSGNSGPTGFNQLQFLCVNRGGSTPPVAADQTTGASISTTGTLIFMADASCYYQGISFTTSTTSAIGLGFSGTGASGYTQYFLNCRLALTAASSVDMLSAQVPVRAVLDNTTVSFGGSGQKITTTAFNMPLELVWMNTANAVLGTVPASLFVSNSGPLILATCRGVDLSAVTTVLVTNGVSYYSKYMFDSCKIASAVVRYNATSVVNTGDEVELINCYDGSHILSERYTPAGTLTTDRSTTLVGGAQDDVGLYSHKLVSSANAGTFAQPFESFWMDVENTLTGTSHTATVEIISSATLNNTDISLVLEYQGTSGSSLASFTSTLPSALTASSAVAASTATWNNPPGTPQKQHLQATFTPQTAGRVRGLVRLGKPSTTVWINPQIIVT